jgi:hypothetical protein
MTDLTPKVLRERARIVVDEVDRVIPIKTTLSHSVIDLLWTRIEVAFTALVAEAQVSRDKEWGAILQRICGGQSGEAPFPCPDEASIRGWFQQQVAEARQASWAPTCRETGRLAVEGRCLDHGGDSCLMANELVLARQQQREADAVLVENMWQPSVGGYPSGNEIAAAIREGRHE